MPTTTIKVDSAIRDRLAHLARASGTTMSALLSDGAERLETDQRWSDIEASYQRMRHQDPDGWDEYLEPVGAMASVIPPEISSLSLRR